MKTKLLLCIILSNISSTLLSGLVSVDAQVGPGNHGNINKASICTRDGGNYILRSRPGQKYRTTMLIPSGKIVVLMSDSTVVDGFTWRKINFSGRKGWVRGDYLCN